VEALTIAYACCSRWSGALVPQVGTIRAACRRSSQVAGYTSAAAASVRQLLLTMRARLHDTRPASCVYGGICARGTCATLLAKLHVHTLCPIGKEQLRDVCCCLTMLGACDTAGRVTQVQCMLGAATFSGGAACTTALVQLCVLAGGGVPLLLSCFAFLLGCSAAAYCSTPCPACGMQEVAWDALACLTFLLCHSAVAS
jgi:hypothetical protein